METRTKTLLLVMMAWVAGPWIGSVLVGQESPSAALAHSDQEGALSNLVRRFVDAAPMLWDDAVSLNLSARDGSPEELTALEALKERLIGEGFRVSSSRPRTAPEGVGRLELSVRAQDRWRRTLTLTPLDASLAAPVLVEPYWVSPFRTPLAPAEILAMGEPKKSKKSAVRDARRAAQREWERRNLEGRGRNLSIEHFPSEILMESVGREGYVAFVRVRVPVDAVSMSPERPSGGKATSPRETRRGLRGAILPSVLMLGGIFMLYRYLDFKTHGWHTGLLRCAFGMILMLGACRMLGLTPW